MTPHQVEIAEAILAGVSRGDLAAHLGVTRRAVDGRLHLMKQRFKVDTYAALVDLLRQSRPHTNQTIQKARENPRQWFHV
ncbi:MAG: hypothetical protein RL756_687 [Pseudomonadota bacterium]|jgi:FixJ family two-component response regulator